MAKEELFYIGPVNGDKIKAVVNWIDKEAKIHRECGHTIREEWGPGRKHLKPWCETCERLCDDHEITVGHFGVSFKDKYPYDSGGDVLTFEGKGKTWSFK